MALLPSFWPTTALKPSGDTFADTFQTHLDVLLAQLDEQVGQLKRNMVNILHLVYALYHRQKEWGAESDQDFFERLQPRTGFSTTYLRDLVKIGSMLQAHHEFSGVEQSLTISVLRALAYREPDVQKALLHKIYNEFQTLTAAEVRAYELQTLDSASAAAESTERPISKLTPRLLNRQPWGEVQWGERQVFWLSVPAGERPDAEQRQWLREWLEYWEREETPED